MNIIAGTSDGFLIEATKDEVREILRATTGTDVTEIKIGQKIPAVDYASTIKQVKGLNESHRYKELVNEIQRFNTEFNKLDKKVSQVKDL